MRFETLRTHRTGPVLFAVEQRLCHAVLYRHRVSQTGGDPRFCLDGLIGKNFIAKFFEMGKFFRGGGVSEGYVYMWLDDLRKIYIV